MAYTLDNLRTDIRNYTEVSSTVLSDSVLAIQLTVDAKTLNLASGDTLYMYGARPSPCCCITSTIGLCSVNFVSDSSSRRATISSPELSFRDTVSPFLYGVSINIL